MDGEWLVRHHTDSYAYPNTDADTYADTHPDTYANPDTDPDPDSPAEFMYLPDMERWSEL